MTSDEIDSIGVDDPIELRQSIRDLVTLTELTALWVGREPPSIAGGISDMLLSLLAADLIYVYVRRDGTSPVVDVVRTDSRAPGEQPSIDWPRELRSLVNRATKTRVVSDKPPFRSRNLSAFLVPLDVIGGRGCLIAASHRTEFPSSSEALLCRVAAELTAIALEEANLMRQLRESVREKQDMSSLLQTITDNTAASLFLVDAEGRCTFMNPSGERLLGYTFAEIEGAVLHDKIHFLRPDGTHYHPGDCRMMAALASRTRLSAYEDTMVRKDGTFAPVLCVVSPIVQEGAPIATVIEMHDIGDRKRAEQESLQRAQKEVLLGKIGLAIRNSLMPEDIEHTATGLLGQALTADRCYVVTVDLELDYVRFGSDWHRRDLKALSGMQRPSEFDDYMMSRFSGGKTLVIDDIAQGDLPEHVVSVFKARRMRALIDVPMYQDGSSIRVLCAASARPRKWTEAEIGLVEAVAAQTRTAIEAANTVVREQRIATTLQSALLPPIPSSLPGLRLASHYHAALGESIIGGDFYAVYALDSTRVAMFIGDVSGKGLAAASQVAAIQNMLRYALCSATSLSAAVDQLNDIIFAQQILVGFATLFVGIYDSASRKLVYASCGHEPVLVRRSSGDVDQLDSSGPPIAIVPAYHYAEHTVQFESGDRFLLYTDGLSEVSPDRRRFLGPNGVADMLSLSPSSSAQELVQEILAGAAAFGNEDFRDDVCIIAAVVS